VEFKNRIYFFNIYDSGHLMIYNLDSDKI
jgi:hypothetical protein